MTAPTTTRSAYPPAVEELIPRAQRLAASLDRPLSRNLLMKEFRIGSPKATAVLEALAAAPVSAPSAADPQRPAEPPVVTLQDEMQQDAAAFATATIPAGSDGAAEPAPLAVTDTRGPELAEFRELLEPDPAATGEPERAADDDNAPATEHAAPVRRPVTWPVLILCLPAFVAIWGGWVEMGRLTGFGVVKLLPGIADTVELNTAITLPIGVETYAAYALYVWLSGRATGEARAFAKWSALASLGLGATGQITYHLMAAAGWTSAPWPITAAVACIPVAVLGMGAALAHLMHTNHQ